MSERNKRRAFIVSLLVASVILNVSLFLDNRNLRISMNFLSSWMQSEIQGETSVQESTERLIQRLTLLELKSESGQSGEQELLELQESVMALPQVTRLLALIKELKADGGEAALELDMVEWLTGQEAAAAAEADGQVLPGNFYVRNASEEHIPATLGRNVQIAVLDGTVHKLITYDEFLAEGPEERLFYFISVGGKVVLLKEQYRP
ncbi:hypothetical protein [Paenibacillus tepidiphilus]|uniref:hypothetical protein n=1 Tax=Paenibacillus tepidiphilus TaxID=2608683 RepID=UPI00123B0B29|nr:hypothetical protein [Paenibacillus tepidiphilus]